MRIKHTKTFKDADGAEHQYLCIQYPALKGINLAQDILAVAADPLAELLNAFQKSGIPGDDQAFSDILADGVDTAAMARGISKLAGALDERMILRVFSHTTRNGANLSNENLFDAAFTANYSELFDAIAWVLTSNFGELMGALKDTGKKVQGQELKG